MTHPPTWPHYIDERHAVCDFPEVEHPGYPCNHYVDPEPVKLETSDPACGWIIGFAGTELIQCDQPPITVETDDDGDQVLLCRQHLRELHPIVADRDDQPRTADDV